MKNNIFKYIFYIFVIVIAIFVIYKINKNEDKDKNNNKNSILQEEEKTEQKLNLGIAEFDTINPILSKNKYVQSISKLIYEPLVTINNNYELEGVLASEWAKTSDVTYVIKLKNNIIWSNGEKLTAEDVLYTIDKLKELNAESIYVYNVQYIIQVDVLDTYTIKITLSQEVPFFEYNLNFPIMSKKYYGEENFKESDKTKSPIGTGKYKIDSIENTQVNLEKNQNYWNSKNKNTNIQTIKINLYSSVGEMYNDFKLGKIDLINTTDINIEEYIGIIGYNKVEEVGREHDYIVLNTQNKVLTNPEVRQAILYAIDKNSIIQNVYKGKYTESDFPLPRTNWLYQGNNVSTYNQEKAKQTLQENGWEFKYNNWQKYVNYYTRRLNFNLVVDSSNSKRVKVAEMIKQQLEAIGIKVTIKYATDKQYQNYKTYKNYDMILCGTYLGTNPDLTTYFGENNLSNYVNDELNTITSEIKNITDKEILKQKYKRLYEIYTNDVPYISLYHSYDIVAYSKNLAGNVSANWFDVFYNISSWSKK